MIEVEWAPTSKSVFLVQIQVEALDRSGLLSDVTRVLSEHHVNILSATVSTTNDRLALHRFVFEMGDTVHLDQVLNAVRRIDAVLRRLPARVHPPDPRPRPVPNGREQRERIGLADDGVLHREADDRLTRRAGPSCEAARGIRTSGEQSPPPT